MRKEISKKINIHYKIWIESSRGRGIMGDGKWRLLEMIQKKGSLSAAAIEFGISYRKAGGDIKKAEYLLGSLLIDRQRGGAYGGFSNLTEFGEKMLILYQSFHHKMDRIFDKEVTEVEVFFNKLKSKKK